MLVTCLALRELWAAVNIYFLVNQYAVKCSISFLPATNLERALNLYKRMSSRRAANARRGARRAARRLYARSEAPRRL
ncbi:hypothetical protein EVAR_86013_1 [Eumeta japonica]|uniref:Uncharacterized protein n=1 Tax=Eumeta variegata TaxID=151549 RepID=A0A4C1UJ58_EUMVA|nr:hypothetical protein EVAR_86013_1 [Eumeta japonica]